nr:hypothetical protein [Tanacetum cinerariifolium]
MENKGLGKDGKPLCSCLKTSLIRDIEGRIVGNNENPLKPNCNEQSVTKKKSVSSQEE